MSEMYRRRAAGVPLVASSHTSRHSAATSFSPSDCATNASGSTCSKWWYIADTHEDEHPLADKLLAV